MHARYWVPLGLFVALTASAQVKFSESAGKIDVAIDGKPFTTFYYGAETPKPYLHPLRAADGTIVSRRYPMENVEGERQDHPHHRGLWFTHGEVNGFDFWANEPSQEHTNKGLIESRGVRTEAGGRIRGEFLWQSPAGALILTEDRTMTFHSGPGKRVVDFDFRLTAGSKKVHFGDTKEGTFAIRLATPLEEPHSRAKGIPRTGTITAADGRTGEKQVWGTRSPWLDYSGEIDGKRMGVAIFDHPSNPKHPTYWHVRSYGLFAANVFGEHHFYGDDARDGSITLKPGESIRFRYRVVIHPGNTREADVAGLYKKYVEAAKPAGTE
jgi:hypothetical protein